MIIDWKGACFCSYSTSKPFTIRPGSTGTMSLLPRRPSLCSGPSRCPYLPSVASVERCQSLTSSECWEGKVVHHQSGAQIFTPQNWGSGGIWVSEDFYLNYKGLTILTHFRQRSADKRSNFGEGTVSLSLRITSAWISATCLGILYLQNTPSPVAPSRSGTCQRDVATEVQRERSLNS